MHVQTAQIELKASPVQMWVNRFVGRAAELHKLRLLVEQGRPAISVVGPGGVGKTALVRKFVSQEKLAYSWIDVRKTPDILELTRNITLEVPESNQPRLLVLDEVEHASWLEVRDFLRSAAQSKSVSTVILTSRQSLVEMGGVTEFALNGLGPTDFLDWSEAKEGKVYDITEGDISDSEIISIVRPSILVVNESIIDGLRKRPSDVYKLDPFKFEEIIAELLENQGCKVMVTPRSGDGGADILAWVETPVGRILTLVEAKRYKETAPVGPNLVRQLLGAVTDKGASHGMLVTTSRFTPNAHKLQKKHEYRLTLKDYSDICSWLVGYKDSSS